VGICGVHGEDYKYGKCVLWCYCPRDGNLVTRVCIMIHRLEEEANALRHDAMDSIWRLYVRYQKLRHEMNHLREEGRGKSWQF
jgi:hypothetical protein